MSFGIKLLLSLVAILCITNVINGQNELPPPKSCHLIENSIVHVTGVCELRKCNSVIRNYLSCALYKGMALCDCKKGYLFNECNGQCVRPRHCPKMNGWSSDCTEKRHYVDTMYKPVGVRRSDQS